MNFVWERAIHLIPCTCVRLSNCVRASFPFGFEDRIRDLIYISDHCFSFNFAYQSFFGCTVWWLLRVPRTFI